MLKRPRFYKKFESSFENVYEAMKGNDLSQCVIVALGEIKKNINLLIPFKTKEKCYNEAFKHLYQGKILQEGGHYESALCHYNMALLQAPPGSDVDRIAYATRAELMFNTEQYSSCINDLNTSIAMDKFPFEDDYIKNLKKMKSEAIIELRVQQEKQCSFNEKFFEIKESNTNIPNVSSDIDIIMESQRPKVIATKDIPIGTVVALEPAFITNPTLANIISSCYYCLKRTFNTIPCSGCAYVMFCDHQCKEKSMQEGHEIECKIMGLLLIDDTFLPAFKALLKIRHMYKSWDELILATDKLCFDRMKNSSVTDIFASDKLSILNSFKDPHFIYGPIFTNSIFFANIIYNLETKTSFLPDTQDEKYAAIKAISMIMMHLSLYVSPVGIQSVCLVTEDSLTLDRIMDVGYFPFISNLKHSCMPNTYITGTRRGAALVTTKPIKQGMEITTSYLCNPMEMKNIKELIFKRFLNMRIVCDCDICVGTMAYEEKPNEEQITIFFEYLTGKTDLSLDQDIIPMYEKTCQTLKLLNDIPNSKEYKLVFKIFLVCIHIFQYRKYPNYRMSDHGLRSNDFNSCKLFAEYVFDD